MRVSQKERDHRIDVALAEGRYRITSRYSANGLDVTNLMFCNLVNGRCEVCGARPPTRVVHGDPERLPGEDESYVLEEILAIEPRADRGTRTRRTGN
jgi:hypothetical protein